MAKKTNDVKPLISTLNDVVEKTKKVHKNDVVTINFKKDGQIPKYAHDGDIGMDVVATGVEYIKEHDAYLYHTNMYCESERGVGCFLMARSGNMKTDGYLPNGVGLIDTLLYRGELCFVFKNRTDSDIISFVATICELDEMPWWKKIKMLFGACSLKKIWVETSKNLNPMDFAPYQVGDRIGQAVFFRHPTVQIREVDELSETVRGAGGFGSTGK